LRKRFQIECQKKYGKATQLCGSIFGNIKKDDDSQFSFSRNRPLPYQVVIKDGVALHEIFSSLGPILVAQATGQSQVVRWSGSSSLSLGLGISGLADCKSPDVTARG
jgi:hypothetical protein